MNGEKCRKCGSKNHTTGYGFAAGPLGSYTFCDDCGAVLAFCPDLEGLDEAEALKVIEKCKELLT